MKDQQIIFGRILRVPADLVQINGEKKNGHCFAKERENILYSVPFRNLSAKTQVFHSNVREHLRTRLTHTLEVARIASDMAEALGFDEKLAETMALGHDLGHTPFGHVGERAIHRFSSGKDRKYTTRTGERMDMPENMRGFKHNLQSVRLLVDYTEGCDFSNFVLYGIREHSSVEYKRLKEEGKTDFYKRYERYCSIVYDDGKMLPAWSIEAFLVKWADEIAQRHHDIEDAYFQRIMTPRQIVQHLEGLSELCEKEDLNHAYGKMQKTAESFDVSDDREREGFVHNLAEFVTGVYVDNSIREFEECLKRFTEEYQIHSEEDFARVYSTISEDQVKALFSLDDTPIGKYDKNLNKSLKYAILDSYEVQRMDGRSEYIVRRLLRAYKSNPQQLPNKYINRLMREEIYQFLQQAEIDILQKRIREELGFETGDQAKKWKDYECRNALRVLLEDGDCERLMSPGLMRVIFDYVSFMTDRSAYEEYRELYE